MRIKLLLSTLALVAATHIMAVPAYRGLMKAVQPDGTIVSFYLRGDEHCHECVSVDGYRLLQDESGAYRYARCEAGGRMSVEGSPLAHDPLARNAAEASYVARLQPSVGLAQTVGARKAAAQAGAASAGRMSRYQIGTYPATGQGRCLVLLAQFSDKEFSLGYDYHYRMLNEEGFSENGATGCARDYYVAQSMGQFQPQFDVYGPITLSHSTSFYGQDDTWQGTDVNAGVMIRETCQKAHDEFGVDFSQYDGDGDGTVDMVYVIYAGYGQHAGGGENTIWPHKYQLSGFGLSLQLDGKDIDTYACSSELFGNSGVQSSGIGTVCHEFGHVLGLADHYDTNDGYNYQLGSYDIMDYGSYNNNGNTPPCYNAFERMTLGWMTPDTLKSKADGYTLYNIADSNAAYVVQTSNADEFYLLENRQQTGWDTYLPASGMMITHVDFDMSAWTDNSLNNDKDHPRFCIVPADGTLNYNSDAVPDDESGDLYPTAANNSFTDQSQPAAEPYTGETLDKWITDIDNADGVVAFDFMANHLYAPAGLQATQLRGGSVQLEWQASEKATSYTLKRHKLAFASEQKVALQEGFALMDDGSTDAPSATNIEGQLDDYTTAKGWTGQNVYQAGGWCQVGKAATGGQLVTPALNMTRFDGEYAVALTVKSPVGKTPVLSVKANGLEGKTRVTSTARTYLFRFTGGVPQTRITIATNSERAFIDSVVVVRGDIGEMFADAKEISVSGTPETTDTDAPDTDFIDVDTLVVGPLGDTRYTFDTLDDHTYYSFAVKAIGNDAQSEYSDTVVVYTDFAAGIALPAQEGDGDTPAVYAIDGKRVAGAMQPGIYIVRQGSQSRKIIMR